MWRILGAGIGVLAFAAAIAGALWKAHSLGMDAGRAEQAAILAEWKASVIAQANERREAQQARFNDLQGRFDELRSRPAEIRERIRTVTVTADAECRSLPESYRCLFHDAPDDCMRALGTAAPAAGLDDAGGTPLADLTR